ncbi:MAG TPA: PKD domain-containing protein [Flavobacteriales bacterium]|nr:PKD domain-containing protein [Flavobacteriales bacterium]
MRTLAMAVIAAFAIQTAQAQFYTIADGFVAACSGTLLDSGGESAVGYGNDENYTMYICSDGSGGPAVSLEWVAFNVAGGDQLEIYDGLLDGVNPDPPLIATFTGENPPSIVSASFANVQNTVNGGGCLTLVFTSNESGTGNFGALISCFTPCEPPIASATMGMDSPAMVCMEEVITFDASASTSSAGTSIAEYRWIFADGTEEVSSGAVITHAYTAPGAYTVRLVLTDNSTEACQSTNPIDLQVLVGTAPDFSAVVLDTVEICLGESVPLSGEGVEATTWSGVPVVDLGGPVYLPDELLQPFTSEVTFNAFAPGATLESVDQLASICVSMEHSYMGDLDLILYCPNGQSVFMVDYAGPGSGGGTFVGDALDTEEVPPVAGTCLDYCWTLDAPNGTFSESAGTNTQPATVNPGGGNVLIPGDYTSEQPLDQLVGCPLNGTWTFTAVDHLGADDGFICAWSVAFDPSLYPDIVDITPVLGVNDPDSAYWTGNGVTGNPQQPLLATATPTQEGTFDYVFTVIDNFGCSWDTSMTIVVNPGINGPINITGNNTICDGSIAYLNAPAGFGSYTWSNGSVGQNITGGEGTYTVTVANGDCSLESEPFTVTAQPSPQPVIDGPGFSCGGAQAVLSTLEPYSSYTWSNGSSTPTISVGTGTYSVTVTNAAGCSGVSQQFVVVVGSDPQAAYSTDPVSPQGIGTTVDFTDLSQGNGSPIVSWDWSLGLAGATSTSPTPSITYVDPGEYPVTLTVTTADGCTSTISSTFVILPEAIIIPNVFTPNGDGNNEYFEIENGQFYENTLQVFNRWGQEVYEAKNYRNGWRANDLPDGTYYYVFTTIRDGKEYTGHVTILR